MPGGVLTHALSCQCCKLIMLIGLTGLQEVMRAGLRLLFNGDASQWDRAMQLPHYNSRSMPAISLHTGLHLTQASPCACRLRA